MRTILALIASAGLVGCVGDVSPPIIDDGSGTPDIDNPAQNDLAPAKQLFDDNVYPILLAKCSGGACHSEIGEGGSITKFVAADRAKGWNVATNYTALVGAYTDAAPVLKKVEPGHYERTYDQTEKDKILAWLTKELELRQGTGEQQPGGESLSAAAERVMSQFAGCMTLANFNTANMRQWGNVNSNEGNCVQCHGTGYYNFIANNVAEPMYNIISTKKMFWLQYFTVNLAGGPAAAKVEVNKVSFAGVYNRQPPHISHPTFNYPNNNGVTALNNFYQLTIDEIAKGTCQPKALENN